MQGVVYELPDGRIVKRYFPHIPQKLILSEYLCTRHAYEHGVPTWRPDELLDDGRSIVGSKLEGVSLSSFVTGRPWDAMAVMAQLGETHAAIHQTPTFKGARLWRVRQRAPIAAKALPDFTPSDVDRVNEILGQDAAERGFCHGDLSPANVVVREKRLAVIDWGRAGVGCFVQDVARTFCFILYVRPKFGWVPSRMLLPFRMRLAQSYLSAYIAATGRSETAVLLWVACELARESRRLRREAIRALLRAAYRDVLGVVRARL
ncbi:hypothetical protein GCM10008171_14770 [Methylopila jiangsuensis]|uniref:Aminoglycoside phosphotransferase domain-containing protein n=1 Tax=Methylopila jiangsuensis TaxID=586230 RepID=A0A9W6JIN4_9HYPH|nr:phosphotransferase [Methylopila jiangsuensis]MDR6284260.1 aminoglycoside phosphotransferase (APT) family kinase protein [Methylopila jiangsuensis]GLK76223.1 hypothetical protein GCM10008171_14770 [Methylopila jiangsuensis]